MPIEKLMSNVDSKLNCVIYGPPGSGKSWKSLTFTGGPIVYLQAEPGHISVLGDPAFRQKCEEGYHSVVKVRDWGSISDIRRGGKGKGFQVWATNNGLNPTPAAVFVDSVTWVNEYVKEYVLTEVRKEIPEINEWMRITELMKQFIMSLVAEDFHVFLIAQADLKDVPDAGSSATMWIPGIYGKYATKVAHDVDLVFFSKKKGGEFALITEQTGSNLGKVRGMEVGKVLPFDLDYVVKLWQGRG